MLLDIEKAWRSMQRTFLTVIGEYESAKTGEGHTIYNQIIKEPCSLILIFNIRKVLCCVFTGLRVILQTRFRVCHDSESLVMPLIAGSLDVKSHRSIEVRITYDDSMLAYRYTDSKTFSRQECLIYVSNCL